jgi:hypothetical protein
MKKGKPSEKIFVVQEYIGDVKMENNMVERSMKDVKDVYVRLSFADTVDVGYGGHVPIAKSARIYVLLS